MNDPRTTHAGRRLPASPCRNCGDVLDAATEFPGNNARPEPGDCSICVKCGALSVYATDMTLQAPTVGELTEFMANARIMKVLLAIEHLKKERR